MHPTLPRSSFRRAIWLIGLLGITFGPSRGAGAQTTSTPSTSTPISHLVVIFQENVSFDHYFATYPVAQNPAGEPAFSPAADTPSVIGLTEPLLTANPNSAQPQRLDRSQVVTCPRPGR